eukprot:GHVR01061089.1.p1 GENE.GHVR01061089.1~~GHVR01061089.1.p1  ORF type:complete len:422 (+),score=59.85 GHVR01061089.1:607-1872(+)
MQKMKNRSDWTPAELKLFALGLSKLGDGSLDFVTKCYSPGRTSKFLLNKWKNCIHPASTGNPLTLCRAVRETDFTVVEVNSMLQAVSHVGEDWDLVRACALPNRDPYNITRAWIKVKNQMKKKKVSLSDLAKNPQTQSSLSSNLVTAALLSKSAQNKKANPQPHNASYENGEDTSSGCIAQPHTHCLLPPVPLSHLAETLRQCMRIHKGHGDPSQSDAIENITFPSLQNDRNTQSNEQVFVPAAPPVAQEVILRDVAEQMARAGHTLAPSGKLPTHNVGRRKKYHSVSEKNVARNIKRRKVMSRKPDMHHQTCSEGVPMATTRETQNASSIDPHNGTYLEEDEQIENTHPNIFEVLHPDDLYENSLDSQCMSFHDMHSSDMSARTLSDTVHNTQQHQYSGSDNESDIYNRQMLDSVAWRSF